MGCQFLKGLSLVTYHNLNTPVPGLDQYSKDLWPNVQVVFQCYHLMIMMWGLMAIGAV